MPEIFDGFINLLASKHHSMTAPILITAATHAEVNDIPDFIQNRADIAIGGRSVQTGCLYDQDVSLLITGPGLFNTVAAMTAVIQKQRPSLIIHTGCAGVFRESGLRIGDIAVATREIDIQIGIESQKRYALPEPLPFPILIKDGLEIKNEYVFHEERVQKAYTLLTHSFADDDVNIAKGAFVTVSTITATERRATAIYKCYQTCMEAMEGAGAAYVACFHDIPMIEVRSASNFVGVRDKAQWNLSLAFHRAAAAVKACIRYLK